MATVITDVHDLRHYERRKGGQGQPPTLYGELACHVLRQILDLRGAFEKMLILTSPQERAWETAVRVALTGRSTMDFEMRKVDWLESATARLSEDQMKVLVESSANVGVSVEQGLLILYPLIPSVCAWTVQSFMSLTSWLADGKYENVLMFSHGGQVEARAMLMKLMMQNPSMDTEAFGPADIDMRLVDGRCADTCEGYCYKVEVDTDAGLIARVLDVSRIDLPAQFKALGGGALARMLEG